MENPPSPEKARPVPPPAPPKPVGSAGMTASIGRAEIKVVEAQEQAQEASTEETAPVAKPKRKRRTKAEMEAERAAKEPKAAEQAPQVEDADAGKLIRVLTVHPFNVFCHTQKKLIYAGHETPVVLDAWIKNQIDKKMLVKVR